jgi:carboxypeptidase C (cathepsin A)
MHCRLVFLVVFLFVALNGATTQQPGTRQNNPPAGRNAPAQSQDNERPAASAPQSADDAAFADTVPVVTHHQITFGGKVLRYTATAGHLPIQGENGHTEAALFFTAYTLDGDEQHNRPVTFAFNGGPGTGTAWLHMGALGPRKIKLAAEGAVPPPPYVTVENADTMLDRTDLVFIDAPGTGFSRVKSDAFNKYYNVNGDIQAFGKFIRLYLTRYHRWHSPLFLFGESYGTTRAAGLVNYLLGDSIPVNGVILLSVALDFQTLTPGNLNDLPYEVIIPSYTIIAGYHKKLPPELASNMDATLKQVEQWASTDYAHALAMGAALDPEQRKKVIAQLSAYTGLKPEFLDASNLRVNAGSFRGNLLKDQKLVVGRVDGRVTAPDPHPQNNEVIGPIDPAMSLLFPAFNAVMNDYAENELGFKSDLVYRLWAVEDVYHKWTWAQGDRGYPETASLLESAMARDKYLKVLVMQGIYDLATPYYATTYTFNHLRLPSEYLKNVTYAKFKGGHMVYDDADSLKEMKRELDRFYEGTLKQ